jgi:hypothetical protein
VKCFRSKSFVLCRSKISGNFCFKSMDLGMFDRFCHSLETRVLIDERRFDMRRSDKNSEIYVFGLISGCRILEKNVCKLATMILPHSIERAGNHLKERED